ncbi:MAG: hypothetical protein QN209_12060 [Armatimonadota bacterium]|nr:hypothetical protein [Armatimonadota bacterium]
MRFEDEVGAGGRARQAAALGMGAGVLLVVLLAPGALRRSSEPWIGPYSLPTFVAIAAAALGAAFATFLLVRFGRKGIILLLMNLAVLGGCVGIVEGLWRVYAWRHPAYRVLSLQPDPVLGWRHAPNIAWTWAGHVPAAFEFSVPVSTNADGFRDRQRDVAKPPGTIRLALLGDSMVEAMQVPLGRTAGALLEGRLNATPAPGPANGARYEVLNFGISNFGVGQSVLAWEHHARRFAPDYGFLYVAGFHMQRTVTPDEAGFIARGERLRIRPTYRLEGGQLVLEEPRDLERFREIQEQVINSELGGRRAGPQPPGLFVAWGLRTIHRGLRAAQWRLAGAQRPPEEPLDPQTVHVNLRLIERWAASVAAQGARAVVVDAVTYHEPAHGQVSQALRALARRRGIGYVDLSNPLLEANHKGVATRWRYDPHLNERGNSIFADAMYAWIRQHALAAAN